MQESSARWRSRVAVSLGAALLLIVLAAVNIFPIITNDSLAYISHSTDFHEYGVVNLGYRQLGYPIALALFRGLAEVLSVEPLLLSAFFQGALWVVAILGVVYLCRWWAAGFLAFALAGSSLAYPNLILTEGISLPLAAVLGVLLALYMAKLEEWVREGPVRLWALGIVCVVIAAWLLAIRYPFAVFGVVPLAMVWTAWRTSFRGPAVGLLIGYVVFAMGLSVALALENSNEFGVLSPTVRTERAAYWAAWSQVFVAYPKNVNNVELRDFYDDGNPYGFIREVDGSDVPYLEQRKLYNDAISDLLRAAEVSESGSQVESFLWALAGGRLDDVGGIMQRAANANRHDVDAAIHANQFSREAGAEAFGDRYNGGLLPEAVLTSELGWRFPVTDGQTMVLVLLPLSLLAMVVGLAKRNTRTLSGAGLVAVVAYSAAVGLVRADNYRFLITTTAFGLVVGTAVAKDLFSSSFDQTNLRNAMAVRSADEEDSSIDT